MPSANTSCPWKASSEHRTEIKIVSATKKLSSTSNISFLDLLIVFKHSFAVLCAISLNVHHIHPRDLHFPLLSILPHRNSLHRRLLDGSPRMSALNVTSPNEIQVVDGPMSLGYSTNGESSLLTSLVLRKPSTNMFVAESFVDFRWLSNHFFVCTFFFVFDDLFSFLFWIARHFGVDFEKVE